MPSISPTDFPTITPSASPTDFPSMQPTLCRTVQCLQHACVYKFQLIGRACSEPRWNEQSIQYYRCPIDNPITYPAYVRVSTADLSGVYFEGVVPQYGNITAQNSGICTEGMSVHIYDQNQQNLQQFLVMNTDCTTAKMFIGDYYGAVRVISFTNPLQGTVEGCLQAPPPSGSPASGN